MPITVRQAATAGSARTAAVGPGAAHRPSLIDDILSHYPVSYPMRHTYCLALCALFLPLATPVLSHTGGGPGRIDYLSKLTSEAKLQPGVVIVKFSPAVRGALSKTAVDMQALAPAFAQYGVYETVRMYPDRALSFAPDGREIGIDRMYRVSYHASADPLTVSRELSAVPGVEYAEPERIHFLVYSPNDALLAQQYSLDRMHVKDAWDVTKGSRDVVIGVIDSGVRWTHEDMRENLWINPGEDVNHDGSFTVADINTIDDDGNGYVDDVIGIDFAGPTGTSGGTYYDNDPLPTATGNPHGTEVGSIMAGVGNNGKGIAGIAFQCRYLPVKCGSDNGGASIIRGYDGIVYAAEMGARVINCSWGGGGGYLQSEIDRIEYAISKGAVIVAASGNTGRDEIFTPGAYPNILGVASTGPSDRVSGFSTYGTWVDVSAPGDNIIMAQSSSNSAYGLGSGTSFASPNAAGVAALVASMNPGYSPRQIAEQVRISADNIDSSQSARYRRKIGFGRVNAARALSVSLPSVRLMDWSFSDSAIGNGNGIVDRGEAFRVTMRFKNFLTPTKNAVIALSSLNPRVTIDNPIFQVGVLETNGEIGNDADPFVIRVSDEEALNDQIDLNVTITDDGYEDFDGVFFFQQPTYRDHTANKIVATISNDGNIGFDDFSTLRGSGFVFDHNGYNIVFEGALMIGARIAGAPRVVDVARNQTGTAQSADLVGTKSVEMYTPGVLAAQEGITGFTDANAPSAGRLSVQVAMHSYAFTDPGTENMIIVSYWIKNTGIDTLTDLHGGLYFDWDISSNGSNDYTEYDTTSRTGYAYDVGGRVPTYVGVTVLSREQPDHFTAINNPDADAPPVIGVYNGFTKDEKWLSMSSGILVRQSSVSDISQVIANGPYTVAPGDSVRIGFALMAGLSKQSVLASTPIALDLWHRITATSSAADHPGAPPANSFLARMYPQPVLGSMTGVTLTYRLPQASHVTIRLQDLLGRELAVLSDDYRSVGEQTVRLGLPRLPAGVYFLKVITDRVMETIPLSIQR